MGESGIAPTQGRSNRRVSRRYGFALGLVAFGKLPRSAASRCAAYLVSSQAIHTVSSRQRPKFSDCRGAITKAGFGPIVKVHGCFMAESYCSILDDVALPFLLEKQQDRSPVHTCKLTSPFLQERGVAVLEWPPQSSAMKIIENIWGNMKAALCSRSLHGLSSDNP
ncbi:hypothetical protein HPB51_017732 [Rhipicephalus microplus]|uniref:Transposable element n=1 Tax=Rhipicephalus microplus TaxID=6941 RepID=A0A9J6E2R1_RHIMP|nr:hypothetical protein HPB51_017732 [Rhipicephalus microplus]